MKFIKKSPVTLELEKIEKEEKRLEQRALSRTEPGWKEALTARIPTKMSENLQKAFCMAFRTIFEKGNPLIEKTYRRDELEKDFKVRDFSLDLKVFYLMSPGGFCQPGGAVGREQRTGGQADLYAGPEERTERIRRGSGGTDPGGGKRLCHRHAGRQIYPGPSGGGSLRRPFQSGLLEAGHDLCAVKI